jgi:hypothetical protein
LGNAGKTTGQNGHKRMLELRKTENQQVKNGMRACWDWEILKNQQAEMHKMACWKRMICIFQQNCSERGT